MRSLRLKLSLLFLFVALVVVLVVAFWVDTTVEAGFDAYCRSCEMESSSQHNGNDCLGVGSLEQTFVEGIQDSIRRAALIASLLAIVLAFVFARVITGPVNVLRSSAQRIRDGDLTQRVAVNTNDEIGELAVAFNDMAEQLDANEKGRRQLLADVVHELRTPLSIIQGNLEAWRDGIVAPSPEAIGSVHDEAVVLSRLITDLRDLSLAEAGQLNLTLEEVDIVQLVTSTVASSQDRARHAGITLVERSDEPAKTAYVDPGRIRQVIRNLLDNALRHTPHGGSITIVTTTDSEGNVVVSVSDTGTGIAAADLPHVFEHFYKADQSRERSRSGSGIGLAIVKQLVEAHKGHVRAESSQGLGSTFTITLPPDTHGQPVL